MHEDFERCVRAVRSRDARFDGWFYVAVRSTGIYCRPSCPAPPSKVRNYTFYPTSAAAQQAGYRACKRCRPDASPGSPQWNVRADLTARAMRLIADGVVDRGGVGGLAARLGYSVRHVERQLLAELGAGPLALARAQRAQTARLLIETTAIPMTEVALAAGFASLRSFNDTVRSVFALSPTQLRARAGRGQSATIAGVVSVKLPFRAPMCSDSLFGYLAAHAVPGLEECRDGAYRRTLRLPHGHGLVALRPRPDHVACELALADLRDLGQAISRCRWLLDLDADPVATDEVLRHDRLLTASVRRHPGRRVPRTVDGPELAVRTVLGQRRSAAAARARIAELVSTHGQPVADQAGELTHLFPTPQTLAEADPATLDLPPTRRAALTALVTALANATIDLGVGGDWDHIREQLAALPTTGRWAVETICMRVLGDPDAFPISPTTRSVAGRLGLPTARRELIDHATGWRPWRAYAAQHLWPG